MKLPVTSAFHSWRKTVTLTEQGEQVFARMADHLKTYESNIKGDSIRVESLLSPPLVMSYCVPPSLKNPVASRKKMLGRARVLALETMMAMYMDLLQTYWLKE